MNHANPRLLIISGPSGVGKSTVVRELIETCPLPLELSVSATTRTIRDGEIEGVHYVYLTDKQFQMHRDADEFLECIEVFGRGHWYGTLRKTVDEGLASGKWMILEIDVDGTAKVMEHYPDATTIFIHPGSLEELERRLRGRGTESEESIRRRLEVAAHELEAATIYLHNITNHSVPQTVNDICKLLESGEHSECTTN